MRQNFTLYNRMFEKVCIETYIDVNFLGTFMKRSSHHRFTTVSFKSLSQQKG